MSISSNKNLPLYEASASFIGFSKSGEKFVSMERGQLPLAENWLIQIRIGGEWSHAPLLEEIRNSLQQLASNSASSGGIAWNADQCRDRLSETEVFEIIIQAPEEMGRQNFNHLEVRSIQAQSPSSFPTFLEIIKGQQVSSDWLQQKQSELIDLIFASIMISPDSRWREYQ